MSGQAMVEVLFSSDNNDNQSSCSAWDYRTGTNLMNYKGGGNAQSRALCMLGAQYLVAANSAKPLLHVWPINAQEQISSVRFVVPGRVNALALSPDGFYLVAGIQETLYVWNLRTGRMLNTIAKHYQAINCIKFTDDGSHFVSAGQDGGVLVWNLTKVVGGRYDGEDSQLPLYSFTDHGLAVTDVHVGAGAVRAYIFTASLDRSCKVYDLSSGILLLSVVFAEGLQCVTADAMETAVYVGTRDGSIYEFRIDSLPRTKEYHIDNEHTNRFIGHQPGMAVNCLALSVDGQTLVSGGEDKQVCIWHISSRQLLKTMTHKGGITNLWLRLSNLAIFHPEYKQPQLFSGNLKRMIDPVDADEDQVIEVLVTEANAPDEFDDEHLDAMPRRDVLGFQRAANTTESSNTVKEVEELRAEIERIKGINQRLFEVSVDSILKISKNSQQQPVT